MAKLFPPYLNEGSKNAAVLFLQGLLQGYAHDLEFNLDGFIRDGIYGPATAKLVKALQVELGVEVDGHFGNQTREALYKNNAAGVWVNDIEAAPGELTMYAGPDHEGLLPWPPPTGPTI